MMIRFASSSSAGEGKDGNYRGWAQARSSLAERCLIQA